jgi:hypothetical protein
VRTRAAGRDLLAAAETGVHVSLHEHRPRMRDTQQEISCNIAMLQGLSPVHHVSSLDAGETLCTMNVNAECWHECWHASKAACTAEDFAAVRMYFVRSLLDLSGAVHKNPLASASIEGQVPRTCCCMALSV